MALHFNVSAAILGGNFAAPVVCTTDIYPVDTVLPVHIVWYHEAIAKSTTQDGGIAETYLSAETSVNAFL